MKEFAQGILKGGFKQDSQVGQQIQNQERVATGFKLDCKSMSNATKSESTAVGDRMMRAIGLAEVKMLDGDDRPLDVGLTLT